MKRIQIAIRIILCLAGGALILNGLFLMRILNFNIGLIGTIFLGVYCFVWGAFWNPIHKACKKGWKKWIYTFTVTGFLLFITCIGFLAVSGQTDEVTYKEDAIIVLGAGIHGETVSRVLQMRLDTAAAYFEKNPKTVVVVSGGQGPGEDISEALAMERYLIEKGIPQDKIIKEDRSTSTLENFKFSKQLLDQYFDKDYQTAFTTNNFHIFRAKLVARASGLQSNSLHAPIDAYIMPVVYIREVMALTAYLLSGLISI